MEPITKTHRGIEYTFTLKPHRKATQEQKLWVEFECAGSRYLNGQLLSTGATQSQIDAAVGSLDQWAQSIINDHVSE